jgi:hypothetical protein
MILNNKILKAKEPANENHTCILFLYIVQSLKEIRLYIPYSCINLGDTFQHLTSFPIFFFKNDLLIPIFSKNDLPIF